MVDKLSFTSPVTRINYVAEADATYRGSFSRVYPLKTPIICPIVGLLKDYRPGVTIGFANKHFGLSAGPDVSLRFSVFRLEERGKRIFCENFWKLTG